MASKFRLGILLTFSVMMPAAMGVYAISPWVNPELAKTYINNFINSISSSGVISDNQTADIAFLADSISSEIERIVSKGIISQNKIRRLNTWFASTVADIVVTGGVNINLETLLNVIQRGMINAFMNSTGIVDETFVKEMRKLITLFAKTKYKRLQLESASSTIDSNSELSGYIQPINGNNKIIDNSAELQNQDIKVIESKANDPENVFHFDERNINTERFVQHENVEAPLFHGQMNEVNTGNYKSDGVYEKKSIPTVMNEFLDQRGDALNGGTTQRNEINVNEINRDTFSSGHNTENEVSISNHPSPNVASVIGDYSQAQQNDVHYNDAQVYIRKNNYESGNSFINGVEYKETQYTNDRHFISDNENKEFYPNPSAHNLNEYSRVNNGLIRQNSESISKPFIDQEAEKNEVYRDSEDANAFIEGNSFIKQKINANEVSNFAEDLGQYPSVVQEPHMRETINEHSASHLPIFSDQLSSFNAPDQYDDAYLQQSRKFLRNDVPGNDGVGPEITEKENLHFTSKESANSANHQSVDTTSFYDSLNFQNSEGNKSDLTLEYNQPQISDAFSDEYMNKTEFISPNEDFETTKQNNEVSKNILPNVYTNNEEGYLQNADSNTYAENFKHNISATNTVEHNGFGENFTHAEFKEDKFHILPKNGTQVFADYSTDDALRMMSKQKQHKVKSNKTYDLTNYSDSTYENFDSKKSEKFVNIELNSMLHNPQKARENITQNHISSRDKIHDGIYIDERTKHENFFPTIANHNLELNPPGLNDIHSTVIHRNDSVALSALSRYENDLEPVIEEIRNFLMEKKTVLTRKQNERVISRIESKLQSNIAAEKLSGIIGNLVTENSFNDQEIPHVLRVIYDELRNSYQYQNESELLLEVFIEFSSALAHLLKYSIIGEINKSDEANTRNLVSKFLLNMSS